MLTSKKNWDTMESFQLCAFWITKQALAKCCVIFSFAILFLSAAHFVDGQPYLVDENVTLPCSSSSLINGDSYSWTDVTRALIIYSVTAADDNNKEPRARNDRKYDNFDIENNYINSVNMIINLLDLNDGGMYRCDAGLETRPAIEVIVEALPMSVSISCTRSPPNICPPSGGASSEFTCSCVVVGVYPETVTMKWINAEEVSETSVTVNSTDRLEAFDLTGNATFTPSEMSTNTATCTVEGYSGSWMPVPEAKYVTAPPVCDLKASCNGNNTGVTLMCNCDGAIPSDGLIYSFFQGSDTIHSGDTNSLEVSIESDTDYVFGCRQCNGVNYGQESYSTADVFCTDAATVTTPTTSTGKKGNPTGTTGPPVGLIVGLSVGIPILIIILVLAIWFFKNRGGGHTKHTSDPPQSDDPVIAMNASTTSSLAPLYQDVKKEKKKKSSPNDDASNAMPLYGEVKKDRKKKSDDSVSTSGDKETPVSKEMSPAVYAVPDKKKKSDKPDGNGAGPESSQPTYADVNKPTQPTAAPRTSQKVPDSQPMQELQYAELDHGKQPPTNEIRKPQGEPTEYATVQSVIV